MFSGTIEASVAMPCRLLRSEHKRVQGCVVSDKVEEMRSVVSFLTSSGFDETDPVIVL